MRVILGLSPTETADSHNPVFAIGNASRLMEKPSG